MPATIKGAFLIATPFWGTPDWEADVYTLQDDFITHLPQDIPIFLYHSRDDEIVPFAHFEMYAEPQATTCEFDGRGHQFNNDLSEVAVSIVWLGDKDFLPGEFFDHYRDDHEAEILAWLAKKKQE